jgi:hypothetical protein
MRFLLKEIDRKDDHGKRKQCPFRRSATKSRVEAEAEKVNWGMANGDSGHG